MKRATLTLIMIMSLAGQAFAQGSYQKTYNYDPDLIPDRRPSKYIVDGFNVGLEYASPNSSKSDILSKTKNSVQKDVTNDLSQVPKQVGIKGGYKQIPRGGFGFDLNLSILKADRRIENTSDLTNFVPSANLVLAAPDYVYMAAGLNASIVSGDDNGKHDPRLGYQVGAGVLVAKNFNFEVFYSWMNQRIEYAQTINEERLTATNARLIYAF